MTEDTKNADLAVIIAAYNADQTIAGAVESAFEAGASDVIVVDDGSRDRTAERAAAAGAVVITQQNAGASAARERGASGIDNEFVVFLDADDRLLPAGVARSLEMLTATPDAAAAGGRVIGFAGTADGSLLPVTYREVTASSLLTTGFSAWPPAAAVIRVAKLRESAAIEPPALKPRFAEDYEMLIRLARVGQVLRHDIAAMRYEMSGGKSVRSAQEALASKERIREHYASAWGIEIRLLAVWRRRAAANKRIARARHQAGHPLAAKARLTLSYVQGAVSLLEKPRVVGGAEAPEIEVFEWAAGQDDNIGDSLLRRPSLADARARGSRLHVFHGPSSPTFDSGLGLAPADATYRSFRRWLTAAARRGLRQPTLVIPNAGEVKVSRRGAIRLGSIWLVSLLPRVRVLWIGAGVVGKPTLWSIPYLLLARRARFAGYRDAESVALLGAGTTVPDWAFALGTTPAEWGPAERRFRLALILRGDRTDPSEDWIEWVARVAKTHGLTPTLVVQVRRDNALATRLATRLDGEALLFDEAASHAEQEARVRATYRDSCLAVGDRLHGLIVAATEGAAPLGWVESSSGKIARHFNAVDMTIVGRHEGGSADTLPDVTVHDLERWAASLEVRIEEARARIRRARSAADEAAARRAER